MIMGRGVLGLWGGRCIEAGDVDGNGLFDMYSGIELGSGTVGLLTRRRERGRTTMGSGAPASAHCWMAHRIVPENL